MARKLEREDDKFFYYDDGSKSAKSPLSQSKRDAMSAEIQKNQMAASAANLIAPDQRFDAQQSFESISDPSKLSRTEPQMSSADSYRQGKFLPVRHRRYQQEFPQRCALRRTPCLK